MLDKAAQHVHGKLAQPRVSFSERHLGCLQSATIKNSSARDNCLYARLRSKEENVRELVRLAEVRQAQAKEQITGLLDNRSNMFQSQAAAPNADADMTRSEQQIEEAQCTKALAKKKFNKAGSICIAAQQVGWASPLHRNASCLT